ncbi:hypothetical protein IFM89_032305 [Coptis chinensis]|uniref:non-specific serine/threonine protein kinase n=1 Tax=Coptis chinensis TaxID=261450 RepID=A0A835H1Z4_9MAGN|nr:hypothetical protein IFM89_032305 [Coptis chinensis]
MQGFAMYLVELTLRVHLIEQWMKTCSLLPTSVYLSPFTDYRVKEFGRFSDRSDVYIFGVFLLELVSGREALQSKSSESDRSLVEWVIKLLIQCSYMFLKE